MSRHPLLRLARALATTLGLLAGAAVAQPAAADPFAALPENTPNLPAARAALQRLAEARFDEHALHVAGERCKVADDAPIWLIYRAPDLADVLYHGPHEDCRPQGDGVVEWRHPDGRRERWVGPTTSLVFGGACDGAMDCLWSGRLARWPLAVPNGDGVFVDAAGLVYTLRFRYQPTRGISGTRRSSDEYGVLDVKVADGALIGGLEVPSRGETWTAAIVRKAEYSTLLIEGARQRAGQPWLPKIRGAFAGLPGVEGTLHVNGADGAPLMQAEGSFGTPERAQAGKVVGPRRLNRIRLADGTLLTADDRLAAGGATWGRTRVVAQVNATDGPLPAGRYAYWLDRPVAWTWLATLTRQPLLLPLDEAQITTPPAPGPDCGLAAAAVPPGWAVFGPSCRTREGKTGTVTHALALRPEQRQVVQIEQSAQGVQYLLWQPPHFPDQAKQRAATWSAPTLKIDGDLITIGGPGRYVADGLRWSGGFAGLAPDGDGECNNPDDDDRDEPCHMTQGRRDDEVQRLRLQRWALEREQRRQADDRARQVAAAQEQRRRAQAAAEQAREEAEEAARRRRQREDDEESARSVAATMAEWQRSTTADMQRFARESAANQRQYQDNLRAAREQQARREAPAQASTLTPERTTTSRVTTSSSTMAPTAMATTSGSDRVGSQNDAQARIEQLGAEQARAAEALRQQQQQQRQQAQAQAAASTAPAPKPTTTTTAGAAATDPQLAAIEHCSRLTREKMAADGKLDDCVSERRRAGYATETVNSLRALERACQVEHQPAIDAAAKRYRDAGCNRGGTGGATQQ